ncbi:hypothetical protein JZ751_021319 [Albula glossodonta]|uniref:Uncharacterized protein n=1 Tax=Albula glossodonta TaxID=121402 RepID=A0A8T2NJT0_9TELE|nr:hypothetical protein JZ751_021319 [Albula glossodonta]
MPEEVNIDELLDLPSDEERALKLKEILHTCSNNTEAICRTNRPKTQHSSKSWCLRYRACRNRRTFTTTASSTPTSITTMKLRCTESPPLSWEIGRGLLSSRLQPHPILSLPLPSPPPPKPSSHNPLHTLLLAHSIEPHGRRGSGRPTKAEKPTHPF